MDLLLPIFSIVQSKMFTLLAGTLLSILGFYVFKAVNRFLYYLRLPGPSVSWRLRHEVDITNSIKEQVEFKRKYNEKYPQLCRFFIGPFAYLSVSDPDTIKYLIGLKLPKPSLYRTMLGQWIGDGLLVTNGRKWQKHRRLLTPAFHYSILASFLPVYCSATRVMLGLWEELSANGGHVIVQEYTPYLSLDILMQCIGSLETNCQSERDAIQYVNDVNTLTNISILRFINNLYKIDCYFYLTPTGRRYKQACSRSRAYTRDLLNKRRHQLTNDSPRTDFLNILLTARDETGVTLSDQEICDEVDTFVFEGHDTTSSAMTWLLYYLALYPEHQETCRNEILECFNEDELELNDLSKLGFLDMFIKETLRLRPPVYCVLKQIESPICIGRHLIPSGTIVDIAILSMHTSREVWPDPFKFDPMRFSAEKKINPFSYLPFSAGERNCIGQAFAVNELKVVCSLILKKYRLELAEKLVEPEIELQKDILNKLKNPLKLRLSPIN